MILVVDGAGRCVRLEQAEDLAHLSIEIRCCSKLAAGEFLAGLGEIDHDYGWLNIEGLRALSPLRDVGTWDDQFDAAMIYAKGKGWTDPTGEFVRAHI